MIIVLDANSIVAAVLSSAGPCAEILDRWREGEFEIGVSPKLLAELARVLAYPRITRRYHVSMELAQMAISELGEAGVMTEDNPSPRGLVPDDPEDDYVLVMSEACGARYVVTRDKHFDSVDRSAISAEILSPEEFLRLHRGQGTE